MKRLLYKFWVCIALLCSLVGNTLLGEDVLVNAKGVSASYRGAINAAIVSALEQRYGNTVSSTECTKIANNIVSSSVKENGALKDQRDVNLTDNVTHDIKNTAGGRIDGYRVISERFDEATKRYHVELEVRFGRYELPGEPQDNNRRRMVILTFRPVKNTYSWYGQTGGTVDWVHALNDKLNVRLTQTRKFNILDRKYEQEVNDELAHLTDANSDPADQVRACKKLNTDYVVVGEVTFHDVLPPPVNPFTGRAMPQTSALFAEITYRVILAPTGQLKWTDTVQLDAASFAVGSLGAFISSTTEAAAALITDGIMSNILPLEVVSVTKGGKLVIGEGGKQVCVGEFFTVFALGETVTDSRTREVLDQIEEAIGTVQITRVSPKVSYAQVVEGDISKMVPGSRLRRVSPTAGTDQGDEDVQPATPVKTTPTGGVILPF